MTTRSWDQTSRWIEGGSSGRTGARSRRGQGLIRLALMYPLLFLLLALGVDFGMAMQSAYDLATLAREAGESAGDRDLSDAQTAQLVESLAKQHNLQASRLTLAISRRKLAGEASVRLELTYRHAPLIPVLIRAADNMIHLKAVSTASRRSVS